MTPIDAELRFEFTRAGEITSYRTLRQVDPWKVIRGFSHGTGECLVHLNNVSGGVLGGDRLRLYGALKCRAEAQVTTTGATRLYRPRSRTEETSLHSEFHLGEDSLLELVPDPLIPYREVRATLHTTFHMAAGSTLFAWDTIAPGRVAHGEQFAYESLRLSTEIYAAGVPVLLDRLLLEPQRWPIRSPARFGRKASYLVTFLALQAGAGRQEMQHLEAGLNSLLKEVAPPAPNELWGASMLAAHGVMVRGTACSSLHLPGLLYTLWSHSKQALLGRKAVMPRKTY